MNLSLNKDANIYKTYIDYQYTDAGGVVFHSRYIDIAEKARGHLFRSLIEDKETRKKYIWVVRDIKIDYLEPAKLEDLVEVRTYMVNIKNCSIILQQDFFVNNKLIVKMLIRLVSLNKNFSFVKIDKYIRDKFKEYGIGDKI